MDQPAEKLTPDQLDTILKLTSVLANTNQRQKPT